MEVKPEHEFFGREIDFDDIRGIKKVFQPGLLSLSRFFNPISLKNAVSELCGYGPKEVLVYFNAIEDVNIISESKDKKRKWWKTFQTFAPLVEHFPAGCEIEYWYGPSGKEFSLPEFKEENPPYQAFIRLFNDALQGFSCFVNENPNKMDFSSWRSNYETIKPGEELICDKTTLWTGNSDVLIESARMLHDAFFEMERRGYKVGVQEMMGDRRREIRIIYPERGALVGSLLGSDSVTLFIENNSLDELVQRYMDRNHLIHISFSRRAG